MTRYLALAYGLFVTALMLVLGLGDYKSDNYSQTIFGYGRFNTNAVYFALGVLGLAAWWNFVQWRKTATGPASTSIHFVLANIWFALGVAMILGTWVHPSSNRRVSLFGFGRYEIPTMYLTNAIAFAASLVHLRWWRKSGRPGVFEAAHFALANAWFLAAIVIFLGFGDHRDSRMYATFFGYGKANEVPFYLAIGLMVLAAVWNFRAWRRTPVSVPILTPVRPAFEPAPVSSRRIPQVVWLIAFTLGLALLGSIITTSTKVSEPPARMFDGRGPEIFNDRFAPAEVNVDARASADRPAWIFTFPLLIVAIVVGFVVSARYFRNAGPSAEVGRGVQASPGYTIILGLWALGGVMITIGAYLTFVRGQHFSYYVGMIGNTTLIAGIPTLVRYLWISYGANPAQRYRGDESGFVKPALVDEPYRAEAPRSPRVCPQCRAPIAADAPQGLCPRCLMAGAFQSILNPNRTSPYAGSLEPPTPEEVQEFFPHLEIFGLIGHGGMGAVYQARQPNLDRVVALKLIRPREDNPMFAERFVREAKAMAKLTHANIVTIFESGEAGGSLYLLMEFVDGVTLREAIRAKAVKPADAMKIVGQLCDALEYAHSQGVVHRDIKPENILLDRAGKVKVVDFGLAKLADDNAMSLTHTRQAMGTPHYMAPEQWEKPTEVDHRADIYALGVVIYELLTGELPLGRFDPPSVKSRLDARIDEIVLKLLAKEPDRRYQHASDVRTALFGIGDLEMEGTVRRHNAGHRRLNFYEYKSKQEFLGWPIVHIVAGIDPRTESRRIAKGWLALGDYMAIGGLAIGGLLSLGLFSLAGVLGVGILALAGALAAGGLAFGGTAIGFAAFGGIALGWLSVGGLAIGKYALGGTAIGKVTNEHGAIPNLWDLVRAEIDGWF
jgi:eukaryotic-like serine/threonine-protein kinase